MIHEALEYANDQLRAIVELPSRTLQDETTIRQKVLRQLNAMPDLSRLDRAHCSEGLFRSLDDM